MNRTAGFVRHLPKRDGRMLTTEGEEFWTPGYGTNPYNFGTNEDIKIQVLGAMANGTVVAKVLEAPGRNAFVGEIVTLKGYML